MSRRMRLMRRGLILSGRGGDFDLWLQAARLAGWNAPVLFRTSPPEKSKRTRINFFRQLALFPVCVISSARAA
jgi:hypothetical protein